jgi:hypothetical protein
MTNADIRGVAEPVDCRFTDNGQTLMLAAYGEAGWIKLNEPELTRLNDFGDPDDAEGWRFHLSVGTGVPGLEMKIEQRGRRSADGSLSPTAATMTVWWSGEPAEVPPSFRAAGIFSCIGKG